VGLILDSSVAIAAERRGDTVQAFLQRVIDAAGDQEAALSAVGVVELIHGIHRAETPERRARREAFVEELLAAVAIYPLTTDIAKLAGKPGSIANAGKANQHRPAVPRDPDGRPNVAADQVCAPLATCKAGKLASGARFMRSARDIGLSPGLSASTRSAGANPKSRTRRSGRLK
jgi:predicted nucleic acid-binding protein